MQRSTELRDHVLAGFEGLLLPANEVAATQNAELHDDFLLAAVSTRGRPGPGATPR